MQLKLKITECKAKPFSGEEGEQIAYFWHKAERADNGVTISFGSKREHAVGEESTFELEKSEGADGKARYKEIVPKVAL